MFFVKVTNMPGNMTLMNESLIRNIRIIAKHTGSAKDLSCNINKKNPPGGGS